MTPEEIRAKVEGWLEGPKDWIGGFENSDLGHPDIGRRILVPFDIPQEMAEIGKSRAPDNPEIGLGWRWVLGLITKDVDEAVAWLDHQERPRVLPSRERDS